MRASCHKEGENTRSCGIVLGKRRAGGQKIAGSWHVLHGDLGARGSYVALPDQKHTAHQNSADKINIKGKREAYFNVGSSINGQNPARWRLRTSKYADSGESQAAKYDLKDDDLKLAIPSLKAINKPFLPLVSGDITLGTGILIVVAAALTAAGVSYLSGSKYLLWGTLISLFIFSAYSVNVNASFEMEKISIRGRERRGKKRFWRKWKEGEGAVVTEKLEEDEERTKLLRDLFRLFVTSVVEAEAKKQGMEFAGHVVPRIAELAFKLTGSYVALLDQKHIAYQNTADKNNIKGKREAYFNVGSSINGQNPARWRLRTSKYADSEESEAAKYDLKDDDLKLAIPSLKAVYNFTRPYAAIGTAIACFFCIIVYTTGLNQLYDIEIDKINKPLLPLISGDITFGTGILITFAAALTATGISYLSGSKYLLWGTLISLFIFSAYSVKMPLLRWKQSALGILDLHKPAANKFCFGHHRWSHFFSSLEQNCNCSYVALPDQKHTAHQNSADKINIKGKREAYFNVGSSINGQNPARWRLRTSKYADSGESQAAKYDLKDDDLKLAIPSLKAVYEFTRPYAAIASIVATISSCLISIENQSDISLPFFIGILKALAYIFCINTYCSAVNQLYDIEIDKINKPYLPLVSGELTIGTGIAIALATALAVLGIAYFSGSKHLLWGALLSLFIFSAYSVNLPLLRWKQSAFGGMFTHVAGFGIVLQLSTYLFMQTEVFKRQAYIPRPLAFGLISASIFAAVVSAFKDIPDIEGDRKNNIKSLATRLGILDLRIHDASEFRFGHHCWSHIFPSLEQNYNYNRSCNPCFNPLEAS
ncbi:Homogentisate phytyltransferase 1, chloroplastic [Apostasia shenzhenica]|uniref:Homogentisate phytyltransferase 1, chloroplastic n=1 Tax=Apostasia shenzhenica TaxID=1088818 RepID=A0A2I0AW05_9ASPA|nr:Homogentisate phytyltransferase 1, chloroplastic [Apostasia shenzhenica]